jgi:hypothetical protein
VPDFIGTVDNMKEILKMPYSQDPVTLAVYRVGRTLVMDDAGGGRPTKGTLDVPGSSAASASSPSTSSTSRRGRRWRGGGARGRHEVPKGPSPMPQPNNPFSALGEDEGEDQEQEQEQEEEEALVRRRRRRRQQLTADTNGGAHEERCGAVGARATPAEDESESQPQQSRSLLTRKFLSHASSGSGQLRCTDSGATANRAGGIGDGGGGGGGAAAAAATTAAAAAAGAPQARPMPRAVGRQLEELHLLLASNQTLLRSGSPGSGHQALGLRLRDVAKDGPMTADAALDLWMDNLLSDVPESVICWHQDGVLKGYLLLRTEDIPAMAGYAFEPATVKDGAAAAAASFLADVLAEIYLCNVCSCQAILRRSGRGQAPCRCCAGCSARASARPPRTSCTAAPARTSRCRCSTSSR